MKKTIQQVKDYFEQHGCIFLEEEYVNAHTKMKYVCSCGKQSEINFNNFCAGKRCGCGRIGLKRLTESELKLEVEVRGFQYISSHFDGDRHIITCLCKCGAERTCELRNLRRSSGCETCRNKDQSIGFDFVSEFFNKNGCCSLDTNYDNIHSPLNFICSCGLESAITFFRFRQTRKCEICLPKRDASKISGENHYAWNPNREQVKLNMKFRSRCKAMVRNCLKSFGKTKDENTKQLLGYSHHELMSYIMSHPNWHVVKDDAWHLDHIFPIFAFLERGIFDLKLINSLDNLQPLLEKENLSKNKKYDVKQFDEWLLHKGVKYDEI